MIELIRNRLETYQSPDAIAERQALKEIVQEITLYSLWRAKFFDVAAFQGGTCLRILHGLPRFSEDLDFILIKPDQAFEWRPFLTQILSGLTQFGMRSEVVDKSRMDQNVRKALIKDNSIGKQLDLTFYRGEGDLKLRIKLEIDASPPNHSRFDYSYLDFPLDFEVCHQDLGSNFALKIHALLCRPWLKGRDWFDFNWYVKQGIRPNLPHLQSALDQFGPWQGMGIEVSMIWLGMALQDKINQVDWSAAAMDVERFLGPEEQASLSLWNVRFFNDRLGRLMENSGPAS